MPAIGYVRRIDKGFEGNLKTPTIKARVQIVPNSTKPNGSKQPDYVVYVDGAEAGAGWIKFGKQSGSDYVSLTLAAPEFGSKKLYANLGQAAGQDDPDMFAIIWNPEK